MDYRLYKEQDREQVVELCNKHGIDIPTYGYLFVAVDNDKIVGIAGLKSVALLEPLICESAIASNTLFHMCEALVLTSNNKEVICYTNDSNNSELYHKVGFNTVLTNAYILKKEY